MVTKEKMISEEKMKEFLSLGGQEFVLTMVNSYLESAQRILRKCFEALNEGDIEKIKFHIHTLKGSSLNLGFVKVGEQLKELERVVAGPDKASIQEILTGLESKIQAIADYSQELTNTT